MRRLIISTTVTSLLVMATVLAGPAPAWSATATATNGSGARTPAAAAFHSVRYAALGDSYSAGVGATPDPASGSCLRSDLSYPALWADEHHPSRFTFVACSGATTADVRSSQIPAVARSTSLASITVGGNDVGFSPVVTGCTVAQTDAQCAQLVAASEAAARTVLPLQLARVYLQLRVRAPLARIVVLGYPHLFELGTACPNPLVPSQTRRAMLNEAGDVLDGSIARTARLFRLTFVDVRPVFAGHEVCSADPWIAAPTSVPPATGTYHPTATGYSEGYLSALDAVTGSAAVLGRTAG